MQTLSELLTEAELKQLDAFLLDRIGENTDTEGRDEGILGIVELDGFLTAIVSGPGMIMPSEWLPAVWGDFEPEWNDEQDFEKILILMVRHMNAISAILMDHPQDFEPIFYGREADGKSYMIVDEWCDGYLRAVGLAAADWGSGGRKMSTMLTPLLIFMTKEGWEALKKLNDAEVEKIQHAIAPAVREIHAFWLARRANSVHELSRAAPIHRKAPRVGRNDPCPCGSGKKYKKCCLH